MDVLSWIEETGLSIFLRESSSIWAYPLIITVHSAGLAIMVGVSAAVDLRLLGFAPGVPLSGLSSFYPALWLGLWMNAISGLALIVADPHKMLENPTFWVKMAFVAAAVVTLIRIDRRVLRSGEVQKGTLPPGAKALAIASLLFWIAATTAGRLTAYIGETVPV